MKILMLDIEHREVVGFPGTFASVDGEVISTRRGFRRLATWPNTSGYLTCKADNRGLTVHRAVALAWVPLVDGKNDVNHIDGDKLNNQAANLEWCTRSENIRHSLDSGLHASPETPVIGVNEETGEGVWARSQADVRHFGFQQPNVNKCLRGERRIHKGFNWRYAA